VKVTAVVDRIEEGYYAVLLIGKEEIEVHWPYKYLPKETKEGDILNITIGVDKDETLKRRKKIVSLIKKLAEKDNG